MIIDTHHHLWDLDRFDYDWIPEDNDTLHQTYLPDDLKREMDKVGVDAAVLVQTKHTLEETDWYVQLAEDHDHIAAAVGWVDLTAPDIDDVLDRYDDRPAFVGMRHMIPREPEADWMLRDDVLRGLRALANRGLTCDIVVRPDQRQHIATVAHRVPELKIVIDHAGAAPIAAGQLAPWADHMQAAARHPNVHCKLSGLVTLADHDNWHPDQFKPYLGPLIDMFSFDRLMFGSDWPVCLLAATYLQVHQALVDALGSISDTEHRKVFADNAIHFYNLQPHL